MDEICSDRNGTVTIEILILLSFDWTAQEMASNFDAKICRQS